MSPYRPTLTWLSNIVRVCITGIVITLLACTNSATAEPLQYYGTPVFYSKFADDQNNCIYNQKVRYGFCGKITDPEEGVVGFTKLNDTTKGEGIVIRLFTEIICIEGICESNYGEPLGLINTTATSYWYIPTGHYLGNHNNKIMSFKHGTGPLASEFPMKNIKVLPEYDDTPNGKVRTYTDNLTRYEVYCNESLVCSYLGRVLMASQLHQLIPKVLTIRCDIIFCYNADHSIAGLNPKTYDQMSSQPLINHKPIGLTQSELIATHP